MLNTVLIFSLVILFMALLFAVLRLYRGPGTIDRIIIFDLFTSIAIAIMAIAFLWLKESTMLDIGLLLSVVSFVGTIGFTRFVEKEGA